jgi:hypothetical protein
MPAESTRGGTVARSSRCGKCMWLSVPIAEVEASACLGCRWLESRLAREEKHGMEALQVPEDEISVTVETKEFSGEESREKRRRRLTRERVRRYREARRGVGR